MVRAGVRAAYAAGGRSVSVSGPMRRRCPRCEAAPGWRCGRFVGELWTPLKGFHKERQRKPEPGDFLKDGRRARVCRALLAAVLNGMAHEEFRTAVAEVEEWSSGQGS